MEALVSSGTDTHCEGLDEYLEVVLPQWVDNGCQTAEDCRQAQCPIHDETTANYTPEAGMGDTNQGTEFKAWERGGELEVCRRTTKE